MNWIFSRRSIAATLAAAVLAMGFATSNADAQYRRHYHNRGGEVVAGVALGILGAGIIAAQRDRYYDSYPVYYDRPYGYYHRPRPYYRPYGYYGAPRPYARPRYYQRPGFYGRPGYNQRPVYGRPGPNARWR